MGRGRKIKIGGQMRDFSDLRSLKSVEIAAHEGGSKDIDELRWRYKKNGDVEFFTGDPGADDIVFGGSKSDLRRIEELERNMSVLATKVVTASDPNNYDSDDDAFGQVFDDAVRFKNKAVRFSSSAVVFDGSSTIHFGNRKLAAVDDPTADQDAATKAYVDAQVSGGSVQLSGLTDTTISTPSSGQVLKYNGSAWINDTDAGGIALTDLSVGSNASASGSGGIAYNNTTGVFTYTPPSLSSYMTSLVQDTSPQLGGTLDTNGNPINFGDNDKAQFGASQDLQVFHDGSNSYVRDVGTGNLKLQGANINIENADGTKDHINCDDNGAVNLFHNGSKKFETSSGGATVTGTLTANAFSGDGSSLSGILKLQSNGSLALPTATSNPTSPSVGHAYVNSSANELRIYNGSVWGGFAIAELGTESNPAESGYALYQADSSKPTGYYYIQNSSMPNAVQMWVDMDYGGYDFYAFQGNGTSVTYANSTHSGTSMGLDIVYPRSPNHWRAMSNYVRNATGNSPLSGSYSDYFRIVYGVHKTSGGGNYTGTIMRHPNFGSGSSDHRVNDGGQWWARNSTFGEPNGDYTAYAWFGLQAGGYTFPNPYNGEDIGFNDGNASYSTGGYYLVSTNAKPD